MKSAMALGGIAVAGRTLAALPKGAADPLPEALMQRALAALDRHSGQILHRDRIVIADFSERSTQGRLHIVDLLNGKTKNMLVAHGRGSDPAHTGWLKSFSNEPGSNATSRGAYLTSDYYVGKHGNSQRLVGLDATNDKAMARAIVVHSAWYAEDDMIRKHGVLGRSEGCFAVSADNLTRLFDEIGTGRMIYADKV